MKFYQLDAENKDQAVNYLAQLDDIFDTNEKVVEALETGWDVDDEYSFETDEYDALTVTQKRTGKKLSSSY